MKNKKSSENIAIEESMPVPAEDNVTGTTDVVTPTPVIPALPTATPTPEIQPAVTPTPMNYTMSRKQWLKDLMSTLGLSITEDQLSKDDEGNINYSFDDIKNDPDALVVEAAVAYKVITVTPDEEDGAVYFDGDKIATREFVAMTTVNGLGFTSNNSLSCSDSDRLAYPKQDAVAVKQQFVTLENNAFKPNERFDSRTKTALLQKIANVSASAAVTETYENVDYKEDVTANPLKNITDYQVTNKGNGKYEVTIEANDKTRSIHADDKIILPANTQYIAGIALQVVSVENESGGKITWNCKEPGEISDYLESIDVSGHGKINPDNIVASEGVTYTYEEENSLTKNARFDIDEGGSVAIPGKVTFKLKDKELNDNATLNGSIALSIPDISYRMNMHLGLHPKLNDFYFSITDNVDAVVDVTYTGTVMSHPTSDSVELGRVSFAIGTTGLSMDVVVSLAYDISGKAKVTFTAVNTQGIQYIKGDVRVIKDSYNTTNFEAWGYIEAGPRLSLTLTFAEIWDLLDLSADGGLGVKVNPIVRDTDPSMTCLDLAGYVYLTISVGNNSLIGDIFNVKYEWFVFSNDNSPYRKNLHIEYVASNPVKFGVVDECTYGSGTLSGGIISASDRTTIIPNATVKVYRENINREFILLKTMYSDSQGKYSSKLDPGDYKLIISAKGYKTFSYQCTIIKDQNTYMQTFLMIAPNGSGAEEGIAEGIIIDSITGNKLKSVQLQVRKGWNTTSGDVVTTATTNNYGKYSLSLPYGNYTMAMSKEGYIVGYKNIIVQEELTDNQNATLTPANSANQEGLIRVVLTWGESPRDLDSHLLGPTADGEDRFHIYFSDKKYYENSTTYAKLDRDDIDSYGPETTTIYGLNSTGTYSYYVHDFTNKLKDYSKSLSSSSAQVQVYVGGVLKRTFEVPYNTEGTLWHVFDYDANTNTIIPNNTMSYMKSTTGVGTYSMKNKDLFTDIDIIYEDLKNIEKK